MAIEQCVCIWTKMMPCDIRYVSKVMGLANEVGLIQKKKGTRGQDYIIRLHSFKFQN
jgi:hypothetical protein